MPRKRKKVHLIERFPALPRPDGRFQKRIRKKLYYFGSSGNREQALAEYRTVAEDLYAGRTPAAWSAPAPEATTSIADLFSLFLADKESGITTEWYAKHRRALRRFASWCKHRGISAVAQLTPDVFAAYGKHLAGKLAGNAFNRERSSIVCAFRHADDQDWIDRVPKMGNGFRRIPAAKIRETKPVRLLTWQDIASLLGHSNRQMFAMILLGLNTGMGLADCGILRWDKLDLANGVCTQPRAKNNLPRTAPLWPETVYALRMLHRRPDDPLVFRTKYGLAWKTISIAHRFAKLVDRCGVQIPAGVGFYCCRHTFTTYANEIGDDDGWKRIMGHKLPGLKSTYVNAVFVERLKKITDHVRSRLQIAELVGDIHQSPLLSHDADNLAGGG